MKRLLLASLLLTPSCAGLTDYFGQPAVESSVEGPTNGEVVLDGAAKAAGGAVTISTGNAALGLGVTALLAALGRHFIKKRQTKTPPQA